MTKILFVCHGNICRSPMGEFILKDMVSRAGMDADFEIASAATSSEELGNPVYPPARRTSSFSTNSAAGLRQILPWHTKSILVKCDQPPEKPYSAPFCRNLPGILLPVVRCHNVRLKPKCGKMRQVNAVNGSQMVVKLRVLTTVG